MEQAKLLNEIMEYYKSSMPYCDKTDVAQETLLAYAEHACLLREQVAWCRALPESIFLENVAAYRINNERIEECRRFFYDLVMPQIEGMSLEEAILRVNFWCAENATYHQADNRTANAMTVYKSGFGRCGEESTFAVTVLRSVGIAARQVYAPLWSHCDDNHAWVEVYCDGRWQYLGACEPETTLNLGWFDVPASRAMLVHARGFGILESHPDVIGKKGCATFYNATSHYAKTVYAAICIQKENGSALANTAVKLEVLNYAHYGTIADLVTDAKGCIWMELGKGSLHISAVENDILLSAQVEIDHNGEYIAVLKPAVMDAWVDIVFKAPLGDPEKEGRTYNTAADALERAKKMREERLASYYNEERAKAYPEMQEILKDAAGNFEEVISFLEKDDNPYRQKLLKVLTQKDRYDLKAEILEAHLNSALTYADAGLPEDIFVNYVLNPRVEQEELTDYRSAVEQAYGDRKEELKACPEKIWNELCVGLKTPEEDSYATLRISPANAITYQIAGAADKRILFVAIARTFGIPARLNPVTWQPEHYKDGEFHCVMPVEEAQTYSVTLEKENGSIWTCFTDWSLSRYDRGAYRMQNLMEQEWNGDRMELSLRAGEYQLLTTVRLKNGDQLVKELHFIVDEANRQRTIKLLRGGEGSEAKQAVMVPEVALGKEGTFVTLNQLRNGSRAIYIWIREGEEPTEHVLNELIERPVDTKKYKERIFLMSEKPMKEAGTLKKLMDAVGGMQLYLVDDFEDAVKVAKAVGAELKKYPLAVAVNEAGEETYSTCGYNVGSVAQLFARM